MTAALPEHLRSHLLRVARESVESRLDGRSPDLRLDEADEALKRPGGVFVSLHALDGTLRGCIGTVHPVSPLLLAVSSSAINAAFRDPRFPPVARDEVDALRIEISVMSPLQRVTGVDEIMVGRDGLLITRGRRAGLLLPQVAPRYGWDRHDLLRQACAKAGLPADAWHSPECTIERFSAEVFSEPNN